ncbi:MAG: thermonuclease family protein [Polyangiales bacterium]
MMQLAVKVLHVLLVHTSSSVPRRSFPIGLPSLFAFVLVAGCHHEPAPTTGGVPSDRYSATLKARAEAEGAATNDTTNVASSTDAGTARPTKSNANSNIDSEGLIVGDFDLPADAVIDGDTIEVEGVKGSLRLLGIDTEETFKNRKDLRDSAHFDAYLVAKRDGNHRPQKAATPMGEEAKHFAKDFFHGVKSVHLERDTAKAIRGYYGRFLSYVFAFKDGKWVNYNVEAVRAGMSPYFMKYGYSERYHDAFVQAEAEARAAQRGIWAPGAQAYADYPERIQWWKSRGDFIAAFDKRAEGRDDYVKLTDWDSILRIEQHLDKHVTVLGTVERITPMSKGLMRVDLSQKQFRSFPIIFFNNEAFKQSGIEHAMGEYVAITGKVMLYKEKILELGVWDAKDVRVQPIAPSKFEN